MSWQILVGLSILLYSFSVILQRYLMRDEKSEPISFAIFFQIGVAIVIGLIVLLTQGSIPLPNLSGIVWSVLVMTAAYALSNIFIFRSLKLTEASKFSVIFSGKTVFTILGVSIFFSEKLSSVQWIGAMLILVGIFIVSVKDIKKKLNHGDLLALIAAIFFGIANTNDRFLVKYFDPYSYVVIGFLLPGLVLAAVYPKKLKNISSYLKFNFLKKGLLLLVIYGFSAVTFFSALTITTNSSQLYTINSFSAILTVVLSVVFLKEKDDIGRKLLGAVVSVVGLLLVNS